MKLYKNVDVCDLDSILKSGILSMDACGNNNWADDKRSDNATDVVYLFSPKTCVNSFTQYGIALVEVEVFDAKKNQMFENDVNISMYDEYIISSVSTSEIKAVYIPKIFKDKINLPESVSDKITWCDMVCNYYYLKGLFAEKSVATNDVLNTFANTARVDCSNAFNFFRGVSEKNTIIDLADIQYII